MAEEDIDIAAIAARFLAQAPPLQFPPVLDGAPADAPLHTASLAPLRQRTVPQCTAERAAQALCGPIRLCGGLARCLLSTNWFGGPRLLLTACNRWRPVDVKAVVDNAEVMESVAPKARKAYNLDQMTSIDGPDGKVRPLYAPATASPSLATVS